LDRLSEHRSRAVVLVRDGRQVLVPMPRPDEIPPAWHAPDGRVLKRREEFIPGAPFALRVADGTVPARVEPAP